MKALLSNPTLWHECLMNICIMLACLAVMCWAIDVLWRIAREAYDAK